MKCRRILAMSLAVCSCGLTEIGEQHNSVNSTGGVWGGIPENESGGGMRQVCYMTALDYQKGYDWRADTAKETVKCSLVVYADGIPVMKVPVGEQYETGADPDMHRIVKGHLYTDYSTDSETVIRKDGQHLLRYAGREVICGLDVIGEDIYTLGRNRDGSGFSYRRNGDILFSRQNGCLIGGMRNHEDSLSFSFYDEIQSSEGSVERYYSVINGKVVQVAVREDIKKVWDVVCTSSEVIYLASVTGLSAPVLFIGERMTALQLPKGAELLSSSLCLSEDMLGVEMIYRSGKALYTSLWMNGVVLKTFEKDMISSSVCLLDKGICCVLNPPDNGSEGVVYRCGDQYPMPEGYLCMGNNAMAMVNGILQVGLSPVKAGRPLVWKDGQLDTLTINGYISAIYVSDDMKISGKD